MNQQHTPNDLQAMTRLCEAQRKKIDQLQRQIKRQALQIQEYERMFFSAETGENSK